MFLSALPVSDIIKTKQKIEYNNSELQIRITKLEIKLEVRLETDLKSG